MKSEGTTMVDHSNPEDRALVANVEITAAAAAVWEALADYNAMYTWAPGIEDTEQISDAAIGVCAMRRNTAIGFGAIDQTVSEWDEGASFTYSAGALGPFAGTLTIYEVRETGAESNECSLQIVYDLADASMARSPQEAQFTGKLQGGLGEILGALKARVETGELVRHYKSS